MSAADHRIKRQRLLALLEEAGGDAIALTSATALSWYLEGARVHTSLLGAPIAAVLVERDRDLVRVFDNELDRLVAEELGGLPGLALEAVPWHAPLLPPPGSRAAGPQTIHREESLAAPLRAARAALLPAERDRYAALCRDAAAVLTRELSDAHPDETERSLAARISGAVVALGADPAVVLVAGAERLGHRHPLPTRQRLGERTMVVLCARRHGLIANLSRWIRFTPEDTRATDRAAALRAVEADVLRATRAGATLRSILAAAAAAYPRHGFATDEWTRHHQGGAAGYAGRDPRATPDTADRVQDGQAFAWNPSAPAAKIEDTVVVDGDRITVLTRDSAWPEIDVDGIPRPLELTL
ncbi:Xaa-Pro aminopeptidase [Rathayibacter sp. PhB152]|uniref:M24 family metallopeptidase n=1 Tax=Rathayibacter sp. PhB152 TaxID=2485190 RepID=UPI000F4CD14E|nr:M24 family metallopeptidase [Rathayibacter sp. PhB152]ROQ64148.1 Xaa-Pro aminopeptidase [Rathayibacter sp. PhB152]